MGYSERTYGGGLSVSASFYLKFQRISSSLTIPTVLTRRSSAPPGPQRECSHRKIALKLKCSLGDEHCFVKRITLS